MRSSIAIVAIAFAIAGCFPQSAKHRRIAKVGEGVALASGIALQFVAARTACMERRPGTTLEPCEDGYLDDVGLGLIFAGLVGFAATTISGLDPHAKTEVSDTAEPPPLVVPPLGFCAAIWSRDLVRAEAALGSHVRSIGVVEPFDAIDALRAWLSRQPCVVVEDVPGAGPLQIDIRVPDQNRWFTVDAFDPSRITLHAISEP